MPNPMVGPVIVLVMIAASVVWVFRDATDRAEVGRPVAAQFGPILLETPTDWLLACMLVWVVGFPLYLTARNAR